MEKIPPHYNHGRQRSLLVVVSLSVLSLLASMLVMSPAAAEEIPSGSISPSVFDPLDSTWKNGQPKGYSEGEVAAIETELRAGASAVGDDWDVSICLDYFTGDTYFFVDFADWETSYQPTLLADGTPVASLAEVNDGGFITFLYPDDGLSTLTITDVSSIYVQSSTSADEAICVDVSYTYDGTDDVYMLVGGVISQPGDVPQYTDREAGDPDPPAVLPTDGVVVNGAGSTNGTFKVRLRGADGGGGDKTINFKGTDFAAAAPSLTLIKEVDNTGGGTDAATEWLLSATLAGELDPALSGYTDDNDTFDPALGVSGSVIAGTYTLAEVADGTVEGDYVASWSCDTTPVNASNEIDLVAGDDVTCTVTNTYAALSVTKSVVTNPAPPDGYDVGDLISYEITASNPTNATLTEVSVSDPLLADLDCDPIAGGNQTTGFTLAPGADLTCTGTYTVQQSDMDDNGDDSTDGADGDVDNTATADSAESGPDTDSAEAPLDRNASIAVVKDGSSNVVDGQSGSIVEGEGADFEITVTNDGNVSLNSVVVSDALAAACDRSWVEVMVLDNNEDPAVAVGSSLEPGESFTYTCSATADEVADNASGGTYTNTAEVDGETPDGIPVEDADDESVTILTPALDLVKSASVTDADGGAKDPADTVTEAGDLVEYTVTVTNTGDVALTGVDIDDSKVTLDCVWPGTDGELGLDEEVECTGTYTVLQTDLNAGDNIDNTATATSDQGAEDEDSASVPVNQTASIAVGKDGSSNEVDGQSNRVVAGDGADFEITVTNDGNVSLTDVVIDDAFAAACDRSWAEVMALDNNDVPAVVVGSSLEPGESFTYTCSATADEVADNAIGDSYTNTAEVDATAPAGGLVEDSDDESVTILTPGLSLVKSASVTDADGGAKDPADTVTEAGDLVEYTVTVTNTGDVALTGVDIEDPRVTLSCEWPGVDGELGLDQQVECTGTYAVLQADLNAGVAIDNTATATSDQGAEDEDSASVPVNQIISIDIAKYFALNLDGSEDDTQVIVSGAMASWTIVVTNDGNVSLTGVTVSDPNAPYCSINWNDVMGLDNTDGVPVGEALEPGESFSYPCTLANVTADLTNTATATATQDPDGDSDTSEVDVVDPDIEITKTAPADVVVDSDSDSVDVVFVINVANIGDVDLVDVVLTDDGAAIDCDPVTDGDQAIPNTLAVGADVDCTATVTVTPNADGTWSSVDNSASVTAAGDVTVDAGDPAVGDDDDATAHFVGVTVEKSVVELDDLGEPIGDPADDLTVLTGSDIRWVIEVTNIGSKGVEFDLADPLATGCEDTTVALAAGSSTTITCDVLDITDDVDPNTATVSATVVGAVDALPDVEDTASVDVINPGIDISKSVDGPIEVTGDDTSIDVTYTIIVRNTGDVDLTGVVVSDLDADTLDCGSGDGTIGALVADDGAPGGDDEVECTATMTIEPDANRVWSSVDNTATVCGETPLGDPNNPDDDLCDDDSATAAFAGVTVEKRVGPSADGPWTESYDAAVGDTIYWQVVVTNIGSVDLTDVEATDLHNTDCAALIGDVAAGESETIVCSETAQYSDTGVTNIAVVTGCAEVDVTGACVTEVNDTDSAVYSALYNGFTPGFWKNHARGKNNMFDGDLMCGDGVAVHPDTTFGDVYGALVDGATVEIWEGKGKKAGAVTKDLADITLLEALSYQGGSDYAGAVEILLRAAAASTLNTCFHLTLGNEIGEVDDIWPITLEALEAELVAALESEDRQTILELAGTYDNWNNGLHEIDWSQW